MNCDSPNWGEDADWCTLHDQNPLICVSLAREALETQNGILRKAADDGAKTIRLWLKEGCDCDPEGHVCGVIGIRAVLAAIEEALKMPDLRRLPTNDRDKKITIREACRRRVPLGGTDAQALEHGMTQLEQEKADIQKKHDHLAFRLQMMSTQHPVGCADAALTFRYEMERVQSKLTEKEIQVEAMSEWRCSACGLSLKNDPKWSAAFTESTKAKAAHCKRCGTQIHPAFAFCTVCSGTLKKLLQ